MSKKEIASDIQEYLQGHPLGVSEDEIISQFEGSYDPDTVQEVIEKLRDDGSVMFINGKYRV